MDRIITNNWTWSLQFGLIVPNSLFRLSRKKNKSKKKVPFVGYEADLKNTEKILPPARTSTLRAYDCCYQVRGFGIKLWCHKYDSSNMKIFKMWQFYINRKIIQSWTFFTKRLRCVQFLFLWQGTRNENYDVTVYGPSKLQYLISYFKVYFDDILP